MNKLEKNPEMREEKKIREAEETKRRRTKQLTEFSDLIEIDSKVRIHLCLRMNFNYRSNLSRGRGHHIDIENFSRSIRFTFDLLSTSILGQN